MKEEVSRGSSKALEKVSEEVETLRNLLANLANNIQQHSALLHKLKHDSALVIRESGLIQSGIDQTFYLDERKFKTLKLLNGLRRRPRVCNQTTRLLSITFSAWWPISSNECSSTSQSDNRLFFLYQQELMTLSPFNCGRQQIESTERNLLAMNKQQSLTPLGNKLDSTELLTTCPLPIIEPIIKLRSSFCC